MNRNALAILMLLIGLAGGWFLRGAGDSTDDAPARQSARREAPEADVERPPPPTAESTKPEREADVQPESTPIEFESAPAATAVETPVEKKNSFLLSQIPQARATAEEEARDRAAEIAEQIGLDDERSGRLAEVFAAHRGETTEQIMKLLFGGEEIDDTTLQLLEDGFGIDQELEHDLSLFLTSEEVLAVRGEIDRAREEQAAERVEGELKSLAIPELSAGQAEEVRGVLREERSTGSLDVLKAMTRILAEPEQAKTLADDEEFLKSLESGYAERREKMRGILNNAQYERYEKWEKNQIEQTRTAVRMLGMLNEMKVLDGEQTEGSSSISVGFGFSK